MKTLKIMTLMVAAMMLLGAAQALAVTANDSLQINANVADRASLALGVDSIAFADADPDSTLIISVAPVSVDAKARVSAGQTATLTVYTTDDLKSGSDVIDIGNLSWTASGPPFVNGTMAKGSGSPVTAGSWTNSGRKQGSFTFSLVNSWAYAVGNYTATATYTLSTP
jgi:hypothetical protein